MVVWTLLLLLLLVVALNGMRAAFVRLALTLFPVESARSCLSVVAFYALSLWYPRRGDFGRITRVQVREERKEQQQFNGSESKD